MTQNKTFIGYKLVDASKSTRYVKNNKGKELSIFSAFSLTVSMSYQIVDKWKFLYIKQFQLIYKTQMIKKKNHHFANCNGSRQWTLVAADIIKEVIRHYVSIDSRTQHHLWSSLTKITKFESDRSLAEVPKVEFLY